MIEVKSPKCYFCRKTFSNFKSLIRHTRLHTYERPFRCDVCKEKSFADKSGHKKHMQIHNNNNSGGNKEFICESCPNHKIFSSKENLNSHKISVHSTKSHECPFCSRLFKAKGNLVSHIRTHTNEYQYECYFCVSPKKRFKSRWILNLHLMRNHLMEKPVKCRFCPFREILRVQVWSHEKSVHKIAVPQEDCPFCRKRGTKESLKWHFRHVHKQNNSKKGVREWFCHLCPNHKGFLSKGSLKTHSERVHTTKSLICNVCSKGFKVRSNLNAHIKTHAGADQHQFECYFCVFPNTRTFKTRWWLKEHMMRNHLMEFPEKCQFCPFREINREIVKTHEQNVHKVAMPSETCSFCKKVYTKRALRKHIRVVHKKLVVLKQECYFCFHKFVLPSELANHMVRHTGEKYFKCTRCPYEAGVLHCLKGHTKIKHKKNVCLTDMLIVG